MRTITTTQDKLSLEERASLKKLKEVVARGEKTFVEVGVALLEIRERKLWREEATTFEDFCQKNWGWGASRARQICLATKYFQECEEAAGRGEPVQVPKNEGEARALMRAARTTQGVTTVTPETDVPEGPIIDIGPDSEEDPPHVVAHTEVMPDFERPEPPKVQLPEVGGTGPVEAIKDRTGYIIPRLLVPLWKRNEEVEWMLKCLKQMQDMIAKSAEERDHMYVSFNHGRGEEYFSSLTQALRACAAHAVCPYCQGHPEKQLNHNCAFCHGKGLVSEFQWRVQVPDNLKAMREAQVAKKKDKK